MERNESPDFLLEKLGRKSIAESLNKINQPEKGYLLSDFSIYRQKLELNNYKIIETSPGAKMRADYNLGIEGNVY